MAARPPDHPAGRHRHARDRGRARPARTRRSSPTSPPPGPRCSSSSTSTGRWPSARATRPPRASPRAPSAPCATWPGSAPAAVHVARADRPDRGRRRRPGSASAGSPTSATTASRTAGCRAAVGSAAIAGHEPRARSTATATRPRSWPPGSPPSSARRPGCSSSARGRRSRSTCARPTTSRRRAPRSWPPSPTSSGREGLHDHGLAHYRGRSVVDLRPEDAGGKREAVERLVATHRPGGLVALGDELSDVDAFEAVRAARAADGSIVGRTVAVHGDGPAGAGRAAGGRRPAPRHGSGGRAVPGRAGARGRGSLGRLDPGHRRDAAAAGDRRDRAGGVADDGQERRREQAEQDGQRGRRGQPAPQQRAVAQGRGIGRAARA